MDAVVTPGVVIQAGMRPYHSALLSLFCVAAAIGAPMLCAPLAGVTLVEAAAVVGTTLLLEYAASATAALLSLPVLYSLLVPVWTAGGLILAQFLLFDAFSGGPGRVAAFLRRARERGEHSFFHRYGIAGLIPGIWVVGFYVCPAIAWLMGWRRLHAVSLMLTSYIVAMVLTWAAATGLLTMFFPGVVG